MTCSGAGRLVTVVSTLRAFLKPKLSLAYAASISAYEPAWTSVMPSKEVLM